VFFGMAGAFGDWRLDINEKWNVNRSSAPVENFEAIRQQMKMTLRVAEENRQTKHEETASTALKQWESFLEHGTSCYLLKKKVQSLGVRFHKGYVFIPLRDVSGKLWSFQIISPDGAKRFLTGGRKRGCFHRLGVIEDGKPILITEGYATGASVYKATRIPTVIAFDAGNLEDVVEELKRAYPKSSLTIAGDDDQKNEKNVGREKAEVTATRFNCNVVFPQFRNPEAAGTDFNDLYLQQGLEEVKTQILSSLEGKKLKTLKMKSLLSMALRSREMIMEPIIPEQGLCMIHAQRGIGKTHVSLLIAYTVAMGLNMFDERWKCKRTRKVLFVDGEMPLNVIQERLSKIYQSEQQDLVANDQLLVITPDIQSNGIPDLSTPDGQNLIE
jgi:putative DNA primase/helicase